MPTPIERPPSLDEEKDRIESIDFPPLTVKFDDVKQTVYVHYPDWTSEITTDDAKLQFDFNNRMYLSTEQRVNTEKYLKVNLLGGSVSFDVDLSRSGCGCLTALYAVLMPASANTDDPFEYCDASKVDGHYCPEFDLMQANKYAYRATPHRCDAADSDGNYQSCDHDGQCSVDILLNEDDNDYGPGDIYTINTEKVFNVDTRFI